jgi:hypothetical protein
MNHLHFIFQTLFDNMNAKAGKNKMADSENMDTWQTSPNSILEFFLFD